MPKEVKVGGLVYKVETKPFVEVESDRNYQGTCDYSKTEISIMEYISNERKEDVFFHELTHAIFYEAGFEEQDEDMINRIGKVIHQVVKNNDF
ncbi:hypothetical protein HCN83_09970 [Bacillus luteus]|uniref:Phage protein n=1 Tax=Alkalicoccus luteus TaxID=1237094 RepID=A0A969TVA7_9BACI|nr:hypothetical protein [Alkalicoccus luteus]